jgi:hypothetical protein
VHEFSHLTFQEYFAASHITKRLKCYERRAYEWIRFYKYHPSYEQILNFIYASMPAKQYKKFWQVLLEEQVDSSGVGHLQLIIGSFEAANCDQDIPNLRNHLTIIGDVIIKGVTQNYVSLLTLRTVLYHCPTVLRELGDEFWDKLPDLVEQEDLKTRIHALAEILSRQAMYFTNRQRDILLKISDNCDMALYYLAQQVIQLTSGQRNTLLTMLANDKRGPPYCQIINEYALANLAGQSERFTQQERYLLLKSLVKINRSKLNNHNKAYFDYYLARFSLAEHRTVLKDLVITLEDKLEDKNDDKKLIYALQFFVEQLEQLSDNERHQLLTTLLIVMNGYTEFFDNLLLVYAKKGLSVFISKLTSFHEFKRYYDLLIVDRHEIVRKTAIEGLHAFIQQNSHFSTIEQHSLLEMLFMALLGKGGDVQNITFLAIESFSAQVRKFSPPKRASLLSNLLKDLKSNNTHLHLVAVYGLGFLIQSKEILSEEDDAILNTLFESATNGDEDIRRLVAALISQWPEQINQFSNKQNKVIWKILQCVIEDKSTSVRENAIVSLSFWLSRLKQFSAYERQVLLEILTCAASDEIDSIRENVREILSSLLEQAEIFSEREKNVLQDALAQAQKESWGQWLNRLTSDYQYKKSLERKKFKSAEEGKIEQLAVEAEKMFTPQSKNFSAEKARIILSNLFKLGDGYSVDEVVCNLIAEKIDHLSVRQREVLIEAILEVMLSGKNGKQAYRKSLLVFVNHAKNISDKEQMVLLEGLLTTAKNTDMLSYVPWSGKQLSKLNYSSTYNELKRLLKENYLWREMPIDQLLYAYLNDKTAWRFGAYPRRDLWLEFILKRVVMDRISIRVEKNEIMLYGSYYHQPLKISVSEENQILLKVLNDALTQQAETLGFSPLAKAGANIDLPPEEKEARVQPRLTNNFYGPVVIGNHGVVNQPQANVNVKAPVSLVDSTVNASHARIGPEVNINMNEIFPQLQVAQAQQVVAEDAAQPADGSVQRIADRGRKKIQANIDLQGNISSRGKLHAGHTFSNTAVRGKDIEADINAKERLKTASDLHLGNRFGGKTG